MRFLVLILLNFISLVASAENLCKNSEETILFKAGSSIEVKLLAGIGVPMDGTSYPVIFSLTSDVNKPDGQVLPASEVRLIGKAEYSVTDPRVLIRLEKISIPESNNSRNLIRIEGWINGEDNTRGMVGRLHPGVTETDIDNMIVSTNCFPQSKHRYLGNEFPEVAERYKHYLKTERYLVYSGAKAVAVFAKDVAIPSDIENCH